MDQERSGPLCWAQHWFWLTDHVLDGGVLEGRMMHTDVAIPDGVSVPAVRRALAQLVRRHEALRTVYRRGDNGLPTQVVLTDFEPRTVIVELDGKGRYQRGDGRQARERVDLAAEPALVAVIGVRDDLARRVHVAVHRISVDGAAGRVIHDELCELLNRDLVAGSSDPVEPVLQPLDQAAIEAAETASGAAGRSARFWANELATGPHASVPVYWEGDGAPSFQTSASLGAKELAAIARRHRVTVPTVVQALLAVMCAAWTGHMSCAIGTVTANRVRRSARSSVGRYASMVRVVLPVDPVQAFAAFVTGVHQKLISAYYYGRHDLGDMTMREIRHSARIGARITHSIFFEYHDYWQPDDRPAAPSPPGEPSIHQLMLARHVPQLRFDFYPHAAAFELTMRCPSTLLDDEAARAFLTQFGGLVDRVASAEPRVDELLGLVRLPAPWAHGNWASIRQAWVNLDDVVRLLTRHPDVVAASVSVEPTGVADDPSRLVARIVPRRAALSVSDLDEHMRDVVSHHPSTVVPGRYEIGPPEPGPAAPDARPPEADHEALLADVFRACHRGLAARMTDCYAEAGGEFFRIPEMLEGLERAGVAGLSWRDFVGFASMRTLARKLTSRSQPATPA